MHETVSFTIEKLQFTRLAACPDAVAATARRVRFHNLLGQKLVKQLLVSSGICQGFFFQVALRLELGLKLRYFCLKGALRAILLVDACTQIFHSGSRRG